MIPSSESQGVKITTLGSDYESFFTFIWRWICNFHFVRWSSLIISDSWQLGWQFWRCFDVSFTIISHFQSSKFFTVNVFSGLPNTRWLKRGDTCSIFGSQNSCCLKRRRRSFLPWCSIIFVDQQNRYLYWLTKFKSGHFRFKLSELLHFEAGNKCHIFRYVTTQISSVWSILLSCLLILAILTFWELKTYTQVFCFFWVTHKK